jgi:two-component system response regulator RstA
MSDVKWKVLLVEDDIELAGLIKTYLSNYEFTVTVEHNGIKAEEIILSNQPDLVILDLMLPDKDGISICKDVRPNFDNLIVMLTASNESIDHILGLEIGADEYLSKPVEPRVLLAHLRALLRRQSLQIKKPSNKVVEVGSIQLYEENHLVKLNSKKIDLTRQEYELLVLLIKNMGTVLSRDDISKELKSIDYDGVNRFTDILVSHLRTKLAIDGKSEKHIKTIRGKGYLFVDQF